VGRLEIVAEGAGHSARDRVRGHSVYSIDNELPYLQRGVELNGVELVRPVADLHSARDDTHLSDCPLKSRGGGDPPMSADAFIQPMPTFLH